MAFSYSPKIVTNGLVFAVDAANKKSYPGSGTTWTDLIGGNNITLINGPSYGTTNKGVLQFDGSDDYAYFTISDGSLFKFISIWFKLNYAVTPSIYNRYLLLKKQGSLNSSINLGDWTSSRTGETLVLYGNDEIYYYDYEFEANTWYNLSINWNNSNTTYDTYLNNTLLTNFENLNSGYFGGNGTYYISYNPDGTPRRYINGDLASYYFYNKEFTREEITQNYNALKSRFGL